MVLCGSLVLIAHSYLNNLDHKVTKSPKGYPIDFMGELCVPSYDARGDPSNNPRISFYSLHNLTPPHGQLCHLAMEREEISRSGTPNSFLGL